MLPSVRFCPTVREAPSMGRRSGVVSGFTGVGTATMRNFDSFRRDASAVNSTVVSLMAGPTSLVASMPLAYSLTRFSLMSKPMTGTRDFLFSGNQAFVNRIELHNFCSLSAASRGRFFIVLPDGRSFSHSCGRRQHRWSARRQNAAPRRTHRPSQPASPGRPASVRDPAHWWLPPRPHR